ncbi:Glycosyl transferase, family 2 [uncultured Desulfobacterium sp.]|uniref:Glycosyl transferase, family 2 n=1 Tax=uncultured Desulfobacterium sp. TaxID=201089 RepID=A0A445MS15_9BACT|nr:Glycosyl transferase, family 2 [uncultured Desulfobacterium sp.]
MSNIAPKITICIPHWQVRPYITICLRSIRKHSEKYNVEVIVVDNGSRDESLEYLRSISWIRLIERPEEDHTNWPKNVFTAWDVGIRSTKCDFFVTMHSDVFVKKDDWLDPFLNGFDHDVSIAGVGAWKLVIENSLYAFQKRVVGYATNQIKILFGRKKKIEWEQGHYPRDYCAMYRSDVILDNNLTFTSIHGKGGGYSTARQIWDAGYKTHVIPVYELASKIVHVAHGTAAIAAEKPLHHRRAQKKVESKVEKLLQEPWVKELETEESLDR